MSTRLAAPGFFCAAFHHGQRGVLGRRRGEGLLQAGFQRVRAGVVGALHGAHAAGAVHHRGGDVVAAGGAGGDGGGGDLVGQFERHVLLGAHGLGAGAGRRRMQGQGEGQDALAERIAWGSPWGLNGSINRGRTVGKPGARATIRAAYARRASVELRGPAVAGAPPAPRSCRISCASDGACELGEQVGAVRLHGARRQRQRAADLLVGQARDDQRPAPRARARTAAHSARARRGRPRCARASARAGAPRSAAPPAAARRSPAFPGTRRRRP